MFSQKKRTITRMAPSPTGNLHIGTARTALYNFLYAQKMGGSFILRIEDTDRVRSTKEYEDEILEGLAWLGLSWSECYRQSDRTEVYRSYLETLVAKDQAYVSREASKQQPDTQVEVVRLRNPNREIVFEDVVRGEITFDTTELGDFVIARSLDDALYHFTVVVDDHEMGVTDIIRGEDHISNTPRQILIQEAIGAVRPTYVHLPLLLAPDKSKLSKRHGAVALSTYRDMGFFPEAIVNCLALLGWNPGTDQEIFTPEELVAEFALGGLQKKGAVFDIEKMRWFNREHIKRRSDDELFSLVRERIPDVQKHMPQYSEQRLLRLFPVIKERIAVPCEVTAAAAEGEYDFAFAAPHVDPAMLMWKKDNAPRDVLPRLQRVAEIISTLPEDVSIEVAKDRIWEYAEDVGKGEVLWPLRVALTGKERSPDPFTVIHILGSAESYKRIRFACDTILSA